MHACISLTNPLSSAGEDDSSRNRLEPPKVVPIVITSLVDCSTMSICEPKSGAHKCSFAWCDLNFSLVF